MKIDIGVAIATFNGMKYLDAQLESICRQTVRPSMISISDDCSTDGTVEYLENFARRSPIPVVFKPNPHRGGVINNFLNAFANCTSEYIAYCDQDDVWRADRLSVCGEALKDPAVALVLHRSAIVDENLRPTDRAEPFNIRAGTYSHPYFPDYLWGFGHQMVFSRKVLEVMREIMKCESKSIASFSVNFDKALLAAAGMVGRICFVDAELVQFRRHGQSTSTAGKIGTVPGESLESDGRRVRIEATKKLIDGFLAEVEENRLQSAAGEASRLLYVQHLRRLQARYESRRRIYALPSRSQRLGALIDLIVSNSYGSMLDNKLPPRHLLLDAWRSVKGSGAS